MLKLLYICMIGDYDEGKLYDRLARAFPRLNWIFGINITSLGLRALGFMCGSTLTGFGFVKVDANDNDIRLFLERCSMLGGFVDGLPSSFLQEDPSKDHSVVETLARHCPLIEDLCLSSITISDRSMQELSLLCNLKRLTLAKSSVTRTGIRQFLESNTGSQLESLSFAHVEAFSTHDIDSLLDHPYSAIAMNCKHLKVLNVSINTVFDDLSAALLETVLASCVNLEELCIQDINPFDLTNRDSILSALMAHCPNIVGLSLGGTFSEAVLLDLFRTYPRLTELWIWFLNDASIQALCLHCPLLLKFSTYTKGRSDAGLCQFFESHPNLVEAPVIYSNKALVSLARSCPKLTNLSLTLQYEGFGSSALEAIGLCRNLVTLAISLGVALSDEHAGALGKSCRRVRELTLNCEKVSASGIVALIQNARRLNKLTITCTNHAVWKDLVTLLKSLDFERRLCIHFTMSPTSKYKAELPTLIVTNEITNEAVRHQRIDNTMYNLCIDVSAILVLMSGYVMFGYMGVLAIRRLKDVCLLYYNVGMRVCSSK